MNLNTIEDVVSSLNSGEIAFGQAIRMVRSISAQEGLTDLEVKELTSGVMIEGRNLYDCLNSAMLREEGED